MDPSGFPPNLNPDKKIIRRIPGHITKPSPKEKDGFIDLKQMSVPALKELLQRQVGILSNRSVVNKLLDKGKRISALKERIENELKNRDDIDMTANLLSKMTLQQLNELEWTNNVNPGHSSCKTATGEESVDDLDPLQVIATHSGIYNNEKLRIEETTDTLITKADLENISSDTNESAEDRPTYLPARAVSPTPSNSSSVLSDLEAYTARICKRYDQTKGKERFKPNKLSKPITDTREHRGTNNKGKKNSSLWEESSAAPPPPVHGDTKLLSLQESLSLQVEQTEKLKYIQTKHAAERLMSLQGSKTETYLPSSIASSMAFREKKHDSDDSEEAGSDSASEGHEVYDDEPNDGPTVVCTVFN